MTLPDPVPALSDSDFDVVESELADHTVSEERRERIRQHVDQLAESDPSID